MRYIVFVAFLALAHTAFPQLGSFDNTEFNSQFSNIDPKLVNPAFAGLKDEKNFQVGYNGVLKDAKAIQTSSCFTAYSDHFKKIHSGIGVIGWHYKFGSLTTKNIELQYNYQFNFGKDHFMSVGTDIHGMIYALDATHYRYTQPGDVLLVPGKEQQRSVNFSIGLAYQLKNLTLGWSEHNLIKQRLSIGQSSANSALPQYYNAYVAYRFNVSQKVKITPSLLLIHLNSLTAYQSNLNVELGPWLLSYGLNASDISHESNYKVGVTIKKRVQLIVVAYNEYWYEYFKDKYHLETMVRVILPNKRAAN